MRLTIHDNSTPEEKKPSSPLNPNSPPDPAPDLLTEITVDKNKLIEVLTGLLEHGEDETVPKAHARKVLDPFWGNLPADKLSALPESMQQLDQILAEFKNQNEKFPSSP